MWCQIRFCVLQENLQDGLQLVVDFNGSVAAKLNSLERFQL